MIPTMFRVSILLTSLAGAAQAATLPDIVIDRFDVAVGPDSLGSETAGELDANGQPGVQRPVASPAIFGGERDAQFWVGFGDAGDSWRFGVDPARGLFWDSDPSIHVNMVLDYDGLGDATTFGPAVPTEPITADFSAYDGVELRFGSNSAPLQVRMRVGNRDEDMSPCGAACGFASSFSMSDPVMVVEGGQDAPFTAFLAFAELGDPAAPFLPGADLGAISFLGIDILSDMGVTDNDLVLRSISVVDRPAPIPLPAGGWLLISAIGALGMLRRR